MKTFALIGAAGFIAPRHLSAIAETGNTLVAATDPSDSVGILDRHFPKAAFFTDFTAFAAHLRSLPKPVDYVSVCSPNDLHAAHSCAGLELGADVICEKPLVLDLADGARLKACESKTGRRVATVLQLRLHPALVALKARLEAEPARAKREVDLRYVTRRGPWYDVSWKGDVKRSGGIAMNIGAHLFDALIWLFGPVESSTVSIAEMRRMSGVLTLRSARVRWLLSVDERDGSDGSVTRAMTFEGEAIDFSTGFTDLHTRVYETVLAGRGFGVDDVMPALRLVRALADGKGCA